MGNKGDEQYVEERHRLPTQVTKWKMILGGCFIGGGPICEVVLNRLSALHWGWGVAMTAFITVAGSILLARSVSSLFPIQVPKEYQEQ